MGEEEFETWVATAGPRLHRTAYLLTGDWATAQDLAQHACVETWAKWRQVQAPDAFAKVVMARAVTKWWRRRWRGDSPLESAPEPSRDDGPALDRRMALVTALASLPARQRAVLVLRFYEDMTEAQVAEALSCAPGTVKSATSRGLAVLREQAGLQVLVEDGAHE